MSEPLPPVSPGAFGHFNACLVRVLEWLAILAMGALVLDVLWGVATRYLVGEQAKWTEELARFLLIWVSMLGGALAFRRRDHLGIDIFVSRLHPETRYSMRLIKQGLVCFAATAVFLYGGTRIVIDAFATEQTTPALGWKMGYVYLALPLAGVFILSFALDEMLAPAPAGDGGEGDASRSIDQKDRRTTTRQESG